MKTDLDHLPANKRRELERVVQILFEEFQDAHGTPTGQRKLGRILKIVLFGSYARGGWVDEPHTAKGYQSDFDLLIIVNQKELTDRVDYWEMAEERLSREREISGNLKTPVNFIVHSLQEVNDGLAHGRYFFMDIATDGIALYQSDETNLHIPLPKTPQAALEMAEEYFDEWFPAALKRFRIAKFDIDEGFNKDAAFDLHQACERLYHCVLLVCTFYTPHVHNLNFLRRQAEKISAELFDAWPRSSKIDRMRFEKLKDAYVKARYSRHYQISKGDLDWLATRIEELGQIVLQLCQVKISELRAAT
ncbi:MULTISPECIES: nucleotidyltransferase and HEPN domain-containing protein [Novosphingobium]|nr:nucleotidyltransferase and HEPN domain-containing protein [Novosphingobium resinovorum]GLK43993.1 nucleotidyltransferase [Novosphingobium resinovorum]